MVRKALFRGTWYPYREDECRKIIGDIGKGGEAMHAVLPHAGWPYSAPMLREYFSIMRRDIKRIIILSPSHYSESEARLCQIQQYRENTELR